MPFVKNRQILAYGSGYALAATLEQTDLKIKYIVDDNPAHEGQTAHGIPIQPSSILLSENHNDVFIIIFAYTTNALEKISDRLRGMGFEYYKDFIDCSIFHFFSISEKLQSCFSIQPMYTDYLRIKSNTLYSTLKNNSYIAGTWLLCELYSNLCSNLEGSIAECGVYTGGNALISMITVREFLKKEYYLFDSFEGFPEISAYDPDSRKNDFQENDFQMIKDKFIEYPNVKIVKGLFEDTLQSVENEKFCMVYMDSDLYESTKECCEFFYDKMVSGGVMVCHDYWVPKSEFPDKPSVFTGAKKAMDEFFANTPEEIVVFPETSHAVVVKN